MYLCFCRIICYINETLLFGCTLEKMVVVPGMQKLTYLKFRGDLGNQFFGGCTTELSQQRIILFPKRQSIVLIDNNYYDVETAS